MNVLKDRATYQGIGDHVLANTATQRNRDATRKLAQAPVGWTNAVVMAPRMAIQMAPEAEPMSSTNKSARDYHHIVKTYESVDRLCLGDRKLQGTKRVVRHIK